MVVFRQVTPPVRQAVNRYLGQLLQLVAVVEAAAQADIPDLVLLADQVVAVAGVVEHLQLQAASESNQADKVTEHHRDLVPL